MSRDEARAILAWLCERQAEMAALLGRLARAESPSLLPAAQEAPFEILAAELGGLSFHVRRIPGREVGDHLYARPLARDRRAPRQLLIGHMDTVWPVGTVAEMPVRAEGGRLYGPGVYDMKGGLVQLVFALRGLRAHGLAPWGTPVVLVNTDEEIGSKESAPYIRLLARRAARAFILEPAWGPSGKLKTARKGVGRFRIVVRGRAAHAGSEPEEGVSAILELSHQIQRLFALNDWERGITVNVGTIDGGLRPNVVAPVATAIVDVRVPGQPEAAAVERAIRGLEPVGLGTALEVEGGFGRPPMPATRRNRALYETARTLAETIGLAVEEAPVVGGGSDGNITSLYTATLDGLGPVGDGAHAADEHVLVSSLAERAALLALLLAAPGPERGAGAGRASLRLSHSG